MPEMSWNGSRILAADVPSGNSLTIVMSKDVDGPACDPNRVTVTLDGASLAVPTQVTADFHTTPGSVILYNAGQKTWPKGATIVGSAIRRNYHPGNAEQTFVDMQKQIDALSISTAGPPGLPGPPGTQSPGRPPQIISGGVGRP